MKLQTAQNKYRFCVKAIAAIAAAAITFTAVPPPPSFALSPASRFSEDKKGQDDALRILVAIRSIYHTRAATNVMSSFTTFVNDFDFLLRKNQFGGRHAQLKELYRLMATIGRDLQRMTEALEMNAGVQNRIPAFKTEFMRLFDLFFQIKPEFCRLISEVAEGYPDGETKTWLISCKGYLDEIDDIFSDRLLLMEGKRSTERFSLSEILDAVRAYEEIKWIAEIDMPKEEVFFEGNRRSILSLITNLALNSVRHAFGGYKKGQKKINVTAIVLKNRKEVEIIVSDNGCGIPQDVMKQLRKPFFTTGGTGVGLTEARLVVADHGGTIEVESEIGNGTTFIIRLPVSDPPCQAIATPSVVARRMP